MVKCIFTFLILIALTGTAQAKQFVCKDWHLGKAPMKDTFFAGKAIQGGYEIKESHVMIDATTGENYHVLLKLQFLANASEDEHTKWYTAIHPEFGTTGVYSVRTNDRHYDLVIFEHTWGSPITTKCNFQ